MFLIYFEKTYDKYFYHRVFNLLSRHFNEHRSGLFQLRCSDFFNSIQFTSDEHDWLCRILEPRTISSGNSLLGVTQQLAIGRNLAFGLVVLNIFQKIPQNAGEKHPSSFQIYFFVVGGILTILSGFVFRGLYSRRSNMKSPA